jgi:predicted ABC-type sugar transport system permease subunit
METFYLLALVNLLLAAGVIFISLCRLNDMDGTVLRRVGTEYSAYITGAAASGFQPLLGEWPGWGSISVMAALLVGLLCSSHAWRRGKPPESTTDWDKL